MEHELAFEELSERYLLGKLSEAEREQFEESYFADDALFERFLAVKDELLDAYARGELDEVNHALFEQHFLVSTARRRQLDEAQEFIRAVTAVSPKAKDITEPVAVITPRNSSWQQSLADFFNLHSFASLTAFGTLILIALGATWIFVRNQQQPVRTDEQAALQPTPLPTIVSSINENNNTTTNPNPTNINQSEVNTNVAVRPSQKTLENTNQLPANTSGTPKPTPNPTPKSPADREPQISAARIASIMLMPVASRGANGANTLRLNPDTQVVRMSLNFKSDDYRNYSAMISPVDNSKGLIEEANIWQQKTLKATGSGANKSVTLQFVPALLRQQDYIVTLKGQTATGQTETIGEYYFRVERSSSQNTRTTPERSP